MRSPLCLTLAAVLVSAAISSPLHARNDSNPPDRVDDAWADRALANPDDDRGWMQSCSNNWQDGRVSHCEVREFAFPRAKQPVAIDGGNNGGMTVMGSDRDHVRILYRVIARARTEERARALASEIQLELEARWLSPQGPPEASRNEWWTVEIKAWVPRTSNLALRTINGPMGVRDVRGTMDLNSINGPVSLEDLAGAVQARVQNGPLRVALAGSRWEGLGLDAEAQNGPLHLVLPVDYSARLTTGTIHGPRTIDYELESSRGGAWIRTTLGKGGPPVRVVTNNGPFNISER